MLQERSQRLAVAPVLFSKHYTTQDFRLKHFLDILKPFPGAGWATFGETLIFWLFKFGKLPRDVSQRLVEVLLDFF